MGFINFGNRIKHRKFDYVPRYYDPEKEERERRKRLYTSNNDDVNTEIAKDRIRSGFRSKYRAGEDAYSSRAKKRSNKILIYVMLVLLLASYVFLTEYLPRIAQLFAE